MADIQPVGAGPDKESNKCKLFVTFNNCIGPRGVDGLLVRKRKMFIKQKPERHGLHFFRPNRYVLLIHFTQRVDSGKIIIIVHVFLIKICYRLIRIDKPVRFIIKLLFGLREEFGNPLRADAKK